MKPNLKTFIDSEADENYGNISILTPKQIQSEEKNNPNAGYGSCRACGCKGYISKHNGTHECKTYGHHYDRHNSA
jgi:hypothetical protein